MVDVQQVRGTGVKRLDRGWSGLGQSAFSTVSTKFPLQRAKRAYYDCTVSAETRIGQEFNRQSALSAVTGWRGAERWRFWRSWSSVLSLIGGQQPQPKTNDEVGRLDG